MNKEPRLVLFILKVSGKPPFPRRISQNILLRSFFTLKYCIINIQAFTFELLLLKERYLMKTKQPWLLILILIFGLLLSGCGLNASPTDNNTQLTEVMQRVQSTLTQIAVETLFPVVEPTFTPSVIRPTNTPQTEQPATQTPMPTAQPPTNTPMPTATYSTPEYVPEVRIYLGTQGTSIMVVGMVKANTTQRYVFEGMEGQLLDITLTSSQESALSVVGRDGTVLSPMGAIQHFRGNLPSTQDWFIDIRAAGPNMDFSLVIMLP
jgi:hypothetical protein